MVAEKYYDKVFLKKELSTQINTLINYYNL